MRSSLTNSYLHFEKFYIYLFESAAGRKSPKIPDPDEGEGAIVEKTKWAFSVKTQVVHWMTLL